MRPTLGYNRYGFEVDFSWEPESRFRNRVFSTTVTPYTHFLRFMLNLAVSALTFIAWRSSNITCADSDDIWASCGPIYGLGIPLIVNVLILVHRTMSGWWTARRAKDWSNKFILPPHMCRTVLRNRVNVLSYLEEHGRGEVLVHNHQMQNGGLLWGCPWRPTLKQVNYWL